MFRWRKSPVGTAAAVALVVSLALGPGLTVPFAADDHGAIRGTLYQADEKTPLAGAKVSVINVKTGQKFTSAVTKDNGSFEVSGLPAGTYDVVIEIDTTVFVADNLVDLKQNEGLSRSYNVIPERPANRNVAGMPKAQGSAEAVGSAGEAPGRHHSFWGSADGIVLISVLAIGAGVLIANSNNNNDNNASPSAP